MRTYNGPGNTLDEAYAIAVDDSGNVYVTGGSGSGGGLWGYATLKYKPNGDTSWVRRYDSPGEADDHSSAIAIDGSGNIYVTGNTSLSSGLNYNPDYVTIKYSPNGDTAWVRRYNGPGDAEDIANAIAVDDFGNVYITGSSAFLDGDYLTIKYLPNGDTGWVRRYNGPGNEHDNANTIALDSLGNVYVTGGSEDSVTHGDYATIKYRPDGDMVWVRRYDGPGSDDDVAYAMDLDAFGCVYVTGRSYPSGAEEDYATIKYDSSGTLIWTSRYNGAGNDEDLARAIVLDHANNVYVTGHSMGAGTGRDYATIKYVQFLRGNTNKDNKVSLSDIVYLINYLFKFGPAPEPIQAGDTNCDGKVSLGDIVYLINYLFKFGPAPCI